jgi:HrpA-like RNA helicase
LAAIAVAERVAAERAERIGDTVGYSIRLGTEAAAASNNSNNGISCKEHVFIFALSLLCSESKRSSRTRLLFCTTGVILRHLEGSPDLKGISHIVVDEVHERSLDSDFLLIILKGLLARRPDLKLILSVGTQTQRLPSLSVTALSSHCVA